MNSTSSLLPAGDDFAGAPLECAQSLVLPECLVDLPQVLVCLDPFTRFHAVLTSTVAAVLGVIDRAVRVLVNVLDYLTTVHGFFFQLIPRLDQMVKTWGSGKREVAAQESGNLAISSVLQLCLKTPESGRTF